METDYTEYLETAKYAARKAGQLLVENLGRAREIEYKGVTNLVSDSDKQAEEIIISILRERFPRHRILTEERPEEEGLDPKYKWIIDPLDGTTNYVHGYPCFAVSIALAIKGEIEVGVVYDPLLDELFYTTKGNGAYLNDRPIRVSNTKRLISSLLATGFSYDVITGGEEKSLKYFNTMVKHAQGIRRNGSATLELCYVAAGRLDGFWEHKLSPWDMAAGSLMVVEAGGKVTTFNGGPFSIYGDEILATNGKIHAAMTCVFKKS